MVLHLEHLSRDEIAPDGKATDAFGETNQFGHRDNLHLLHHPRAMQKMEVVSVTWSSPAICLFSMPVMTSTKTSFYSLKVFELVINLHDHFFDVIPDIVAFRSGVIPRNRCPRIDTDVESFR